MPPGQPARSSGAPGAGGDRSPGRRTNGRKEQILGVSADLFVEHGFHQVTMAGIAERVGMTPGALYRHYASKADLLAAVFDSLLASLAIEHGPLTSLEEITRARARVVAENGSFGTLWSRESANLTEAGRRRTVEHLRRFNEEFAGAIRAIRPELPLAFARLLGWAMESVLVSPTVRPRALSAERAATVLTAVCLAIGRVPMPRVPTEPAVPAVALQSTRERLVGAASGLFAERGFTGASLAEAAERIGVTAQSVYSHFASKDELLAAVVERAENAIWLGAAAALRSAVDPADALGRLVDAHTAAARNQPFVTAFLVPELEVLPEQVIRRHGEYLREWTHLLQAARPEVSAPVAQVLARAAIRVINDLVRTRVLVKQPGFPAHLAAVARAVLFAELPGGL